MTMHPESNASPVRTGARSSVMQIADGESRGLPLRDTPFHSCLVLFPLFLSRGKQCIAGEFLENSQMALIPRLRLKMEVNKRGTLIYFTVLKVSRVVIIILRGRSNRGCKIRFESEIVEKKVSVE